MNWNVVNIQDLESVLLKNILNIKEYIDCKAFILNDKMKVQVILKEDNILPNGYNRLYGNYESVDINLTSENVYSDDLDITNKQKEDYRIFISQYK